MMRNLRWLSPGLLCVVLAGPLGCSDQRDATGESGLGAAGKPAESPQLSENEAYEAQVKQEAAQAKERK
jgi:hypothetical protein